MIRGHHGGMKLATIAAIAVFVIGLIGLACIRSASAGANATAHSHGTIFVANAYDVTAYPVGGHGDVAPIALTTDMVAPGGIARDASGRIYVANTATNTVTVYAANANGNVSPIAAIGGDTTHLANPAGIALDASGKIYVLNGGEYPKSSITVYPPLGTSTGILNEAPIVTIAGSKTLLDGATGIATDGRNIYVANELGGPVVRSEQFDRGRITVYAPGSNGNVAPTATISGAATGLAFPSAIALDSDSDIYVANISTANTKSALKYLPSITVYPAASTGNAPPSAIITGPNTGLIYPSALAVDSGRNLYAVGYVNDVGFSVDVYPAGSDGNVSPAATIVGAATGLDGPVGFVLDSSDNLYVLNASGGPSNDGSVTVYPADSSGDAVPTATITSSFTGLDNTSAIAADATGKIYVAKRFGGLVNTGDVAIYPAGGYATGPPVATIAGANTGLVYRRNRAGLE
jgi:hypothetical protein